MPLRWPTGQRVAKLICAPCKKGKNANQIFSGREFRSVTGCGCCCCCSAGNVTVLVGQQQEHIVARPGLVRSGWRPGPFYCWTSLGTHAAWRHSCDSVFNAINCGSCKTTLLPLSSKLALFQCELLHSLAHSLLLLLSLASAWHVRPVARIVRSCPKSKY